MCMLCNTGVAHVWGVFPRTWGGISFTQLLGAFAVL